MIDPARLELVAAWFDVEQTHRTNWGDRTQVQHDLRLLAAELRAARAVVEAARVEHGAPIGVHAACAQCRAIAAYDAAVKEQPSGQPR